MNGWQPMETAPKDGTDVLAYFRAHGGWCQVVHWSRPSDHYMPHWNDGRFTLHDPTHWQPIPEPPQ